MEISVKNEFDLPSPAGSILAQIGSSLLKLWRAENIVLGRGTTLSARWNHRISTDIDLFVPFDQFYSVSNQLPNLFSSAKLIRSNSGNGWFTGTYPEGEFSISTTPSLLPKPVSVPNDLVRDWGMPIELPSEILAKKLKLRIYGNGEFVSRDFYDLCTAGEKDPQSLKMALEILTDSEREEISEEIQSFGTRASRMGRTLLKVHRPEWLSDLDRRTADLIKPPSEEKPV
ncbi:MAG: hypothetical protein OXC57_11940 [Rhodobacteraceae bacterium]|nr:hypothetical protein [Paracoccaceae bacterium]